MGQQQLLLLVLATVIVGLATVAGIQAFDEGQTQAKQDALTQRGLTIGNQITAALNKPSQLGGVSFSSDKAQIVASAGLDAEGEKGKGIPAKGAGDNADCDITNVGTSTVTVVCAENGKENDNSGGGGEDTDLGKTVTVEADLEGGSVTAIDGTDIDSI